LLSSIQNLKHKAILSLIYVAGLRVSKAIEMKVSDIDSKRMLLRIRQAKGKKDRYVMLSEKLLFLLREYYKEYKPKEYLFEGQKGNKYSSRSIQSIFKQALRKTNIQKEASVHSLRHSLATYLLEAGTDIRIIQQLLIIVDMIKRIRQKINSIPYIDLKYQGFPKQNSDKKISLLGHILIIK